jgi:septum formation protein
MISFAEKSCQNNAMTPRRSLVLASTSRYRRELLSRLRIPFECDRPEVDESPLPDEPPAQTARRLAEAKARAVAGRWPGALIIGSDQVASLGGERLDKPGTHENAVRQLGLASGGTASFDTAVALLDTRTGAADVRCVPCRVTFRKLSPALIEAYLRAEEPYDCAGSAKSEGLGIALIERMETSDPTSLVGLPLIELCAMLEAAGEPVLPG